MSAQPQSPRPRPRLQLVEPLESRFGSTTKDPKLVNAFAEKDETGNFRVIKRQGVSTFATIPSMPVGPYVPLGQYAYQDVAQTKTLTFFYSSGTNLSYGYRTGGAAPNAFLAPVLGFPAFTGAIQWTGTASVAPVSFFVIIGGRFATYNPSSGAILPVTAPVGSNTTTIGLVVLDGTIYFLDNFSGIWGSGLNDPTTWSALNVIFAYGVPGVGIAIARHLSYVLALKSFSTEFFYDNANATGSPLLSYPNSLLEWGCIDGNTVQNIEGDLYWLAQSKQTSAFVAKLSVGHPSKVSTPGVERLLDDITGPYYSFAFRDSGHVFYGITAVGSNVTVVYDVGQNIWYLWTDVNGNYWPWMSFITSPDTTVLAQSTVPANANQIFQIDEDFTTDVDGLGGTKLILTDIYTANFDGGTRKRKTLMGLDIIADQQPAILKVRYSEDDFQTYSQYREVDLNTKRPRLTNCGTFRRRAYHMRHAAPYKLRLEAAELDLLLGDA